MGIRNQTIKGQIHVNFRLKVNLFLLLAGLIVMLPGAWYLNKMIHDQANQDIVKQANMLMEGALAARSYTVDLVKPYLDPMLGDKFLPQTVPAFAATEIFERFRKKFANFKYKVGKFAFMASGKARAIGELDGFVKLIVGEQHGEILGAHIIGESATELIAELGLAISLEATYEELIETIHAHPTLSEAVHEAAHASQGHAIHS